ncbi:MAG: ATP-binding protein [Pseudomonadota bacterium]|nr:ATP-binding protein [Pseudomonadota bacterium]
MSPGNDDSGPTVRTRALLREKDELLDLAQEAAGIGIFEWQVTTGSIWLSAQLLSLYGMTEFDGRYATWVEAIFREDRIRVDDLIKTALASGDREFTTEFRVKRPKDGDIRWIQARSLAFYDADRQPVRVVSVNVDVTEQKRAMVQLRSFTDTLEDRVRERTRELEAEYAARQKVEETLRQSQKMEAIGQLTGGVAHDFNNLLSVILGGLEAIGRQIQNLPQSAATSRIARSKEMAIQGVRRAASLTSRLLAFSRQQPLAPTGVDANKLVAGIGDLLRRTLGEQVSLEMVLAGGLWPTFVDGNQLENALLNLAVNARDAMPSGGSLTIETGNASLDAAYVTGLTEPVTPGQYVMIAVTDTGCGMDASTLSRVFEPFFTTKAVGKGTGLGLSQVYGFVRQSSGHIRIYSECGEGTTVKLYLPRHFEAAKAAKTVSEVQAPKAIGAECILVVEDDDALRVHATDILNELGYRVIAAASGADALAELRAHRDIDLLFTDVVMPGGVNGRQLADEAIRLQPGLKVLFTTGYTRNAIVHHGRLDPGIDLIGKPYSFHELASQVRARLDAPA